MCGSAGPVGIISRCGTPNGSAAMRSARSATTARSRPPRRSSPRRPRSAAAARASSRRARSAPSVGSTRRFFRASSRAARRQAARRAAGPAVLAAADRVVAEPAGATSGGAPASELRSCSRGRLTLRARGRFRHDLAPPSAFFGLKGCLTATRANLICVASFSVVFGGPDEKRTCRRDHCPGCSAPLRSHTSEWRHYRLRIGTDWPQSIRFRSPRKARPPALLAPRLSL